MSLNDVVAEVSRLNQYNSQAVSAANPFGMGADGHQTNFPRACADLSKVTTELAGAANALLAQSQLTVLAPAWRNRCVNGALDVLARGLGVIAAGGNSIAASWRSGTYAVTIARSAPGTLPDGLRTSLSAPVPAALASNQLVVSHRLEDVFGVLGTITASIYIKAPVGMVLGLFAVQDFGAGASAGPVSAQLGANIVGTGAWVRVSRTGSAFNYPAVVLGTGSFLGLNVMAMAGGGAGTVEVAGFQLEAGTVATPYETRPLSVERQLCARYLASTYSDLTTPGAISAAGALGEVASSARLHYEWRLPTTMRVNPTVVTYQPDAVGAGTSANPASLAVAVIRADALAITLGVAAGAVTGNLYTVHCVASAEL